MANSTESVISYNRESAPIVMVKSEQICDSGATEHPKTEAQTIFFRFRGHHNAPPASYHVFLFCTFRPPSADSLLLVCVRLPAPDFNHQITVAEIVKQLKRHVNIVSERLFIIRQRTLLNSV